MILDDIVAKRKEQLAREKAAVPLEAVKALAESRAEPSKNFAAALRGSRMAVIAEVKKASPSKGVIALEFPYRQIALDYEAAGAAAVHVRISSPPFRHTCHYGTDIGDEENLIAGRMGMDAVCRSIGADSLGYISLPGLREACRGCTTPFCTACFGE